MKVTSADLLRKARTTPFVALYLATAFAGFLVMAAIDFPGRRQLADPFGFPFPAVPGDVPSALARLPVAPFVNAGVLQLLYVTVLLLVFGRMLERRLGTGATLAVFLGTTYAAALIAATALHGLERLPETGLQPVFDEAWERHWNGGSAGCYGLVGLLTAWSACRRRIVAGVVLWELALTGVLLQSYTPALHISAFATGLALGLLWLREMSPTDDSAYSPSPAAAGEGAGG